jgi:WD40 repeat protein
MDGDSDLEVEQNDELQKFLGTSSFGKQSRHVPKDDSVKKQVDATKRVVAQELRDEPATAQASRKAKDSDDDSDDEDDDSDEEDEFPVSHEMLLKTHEKAVTAATLDPAGGRLVTGSMDCTLKFHDFASMTPTTIRAFKSVDPTEAKGSSNSETHPVNQAIFNPISAGHILVTTALPQAKVLSRDGDTIVTFAKGDMYLRDMHNTKGHVSEVTTGAWHPTDRNLCVTAGTDSTLRVWDINNPRSQKHIIVHKSRVAGSAGRSRMTAVAWRAPVQGGDNILVAAALDGTLSMWTGEGPWSRPTAEIRDAHQPNTWTSGLDISADGRLVVTRGGDDTIKTWDTRKFKAPIARSHTPQPPPNTPQPASASPPTPPASSPAPPPATSTS